MRIISGNHKGKHIVAPQNLPVRPTTDLGKESLFNILNNFFFFDTIHVLDLFAGTGNISYEFATRGALSIISVDNHPACIQFIKKTIEMLQFNNIHVVKSDVVTFLQNKHGKYNVIFADPPYDWTAFHLIPELVFANELLLPDGLLIIEHPKHIDFKNHKKFYQQRNYGKVNFSIFAENL